MASAASELSEPHVLAHAKRHLFPDDGAGTTYAVVDTQFTSEQWLADGAITPEITETLAPFNHVCIGTGYPDLVGVRSLDDELVAVNRLGSDPPLIAIEAKGYTKSGTVDVERGVVQAYDRLHEANVAYVTAPSSAISESARTLARELNVGVLAVEPGGAVTPLELPRVVGNRTTTEAEAIRFQASAQGVVDDSFGLNHPKNYLGYPLAYYADGSTEELMRENKVVREIDSAKRGAIVLGLVKKRPNGIRLTALGREVVRFALGRYGSVERALNEFQNWYRKSRCFYDLAPEWGLLTRRVVFDYPATQLIVEELQRLHEDGETYPNLVQLVEYLYELHPTFTIELFVRGTDDARNRVLGPEGELRINALTNGNVYHSPTVFQFKAILYHAGILTERGAEPSNLDPRADTWALRNSL
ncbi:hypothetical protein A4G99_18705 [Haladaptatus sp. R4]|uniref:hypothetical protein n=1 Tax=Haladaptatus sp. R4 TaxID=1679489 RepID=UPI0007B4C33A|nr:hypothetical protein [Haladaptatus sp. R4]KZN22754.1 hypothetical protein A4G99_18705 [Haladaptatus sp. R4]